MSRSEASETARTRVSAPPGAATWALLRLVALAVLLLATMAVALLPVPGDQTTYRWNPPSSFSLGKAQLMMPATPARLTARWPCAAIREVAPLTGQPPTRVFGTGQSTSGTLSLYVGAGRAWAALAERPILNASLPIPAGDCTLTLIYEDSSRSVTISHGGAAQTVPLRTTVVQDSEVVDTVQVTGLEVAWGLRTDTSVEVVGRPATQIWPAARWLVAWAGLCAALVVWWSFFRLSRPGDRGRPTPRWTGSDTAVAVCAGAALWLIPPLADDGWVLTTVRAYPELGFFSNFFTANAAAQPQGFWWTSIQRLWLTSLDASIVSLRLPSLVLVVITWWFLRRRVLDQVVDMPSRWLRAAGAALFIVGVFAWTPTLRPEPLMALLSVVALALVLRFRQRQDGWVLVTLGVLAALAYSLHQTGWVIVGVALAVVPDLRAWWRRDRRAVTDVVVSAALVFVAGALLLMMLKSNLAILWQGRSDFVAGGKHNALLDEGLRVRILLGAPTTSPVRLFSALLVPLSGALWLLLTWRGWRAGPDRLVAGAASLGGLALALTESKWQWHFGATIALSATAFAMILRQILTLRRGAALGVALLILVGAAATARPSGWSIHDTRVVDVDEPVLRGIGGLAVWIALLVVIVALWRRLAAPRALLATVLAVSGVVSLVAVGPMVVDGLRDRETSWPALVAGSTRPGQCGLASALRVPTVTRPLTEVAGQAAPAQLLRQQWQEDLSIPRPPAPGIPVFRVTALPGAALSTPWYLVRAGVPARAWLHVREPGLLQYLVEWQTPAGQQKSVAVDRLANGPAWAMVDLEVPPDAVTVRISWTSAAAVQFVSAPVAVEATAPVTAVADGPVLRTPESALYAPCFPQPDISSGAMQPFALSLGLPLLGHSQVATGVAVFSEQACVANPASRRSLPLCWYGVRPPAPEGLTRSGGVAFR